MVLAIGNPFAVGQTVTHGIVSAVARTQVGISDYQFFIQTDAAINPGNSGGALVDMSGKLVGINTAIFSRSGGSQGIGFAIPPTWCGSWSPPRQRRHRGQAALARRKLQAVTPEIAEGLNLKRPYRRADRKRHTASPAARAGLKPGDLIVSVDGQAVEDPGAFDYRFATKALGGGAQSRERGASRQSTIALETAPETPRDEMVLKGARRSRAPRYPTFRRRWRKRCTIPHRWRHHSRHCERLRRARPGLSAR